MSKGHKTCPGCTAEVGPRTLVCKCGYLFGFKTKAKAIPAKPTVPLAVSLPSESVPLVQVTEHYRLQINDRVEARRFVDELQAGIRAAQTTGGCYSAFAHGKDGATVQIELYFSIR
jgi:hypothetical protein